MGGGDLNMKKSWHPLLLKNQERVWLEEKRTLEEKKKLDQLRKEKEEERQLQELQRLQEEQTGKKRTEKLEWMYSTPATGSSQNPDDLEEYLLGKKRVDKLLVGEDNAKLGASHKNFIAVQNANSARDIAAKIREDPLLAIKQQEQAALEALRSNPLRLKQLQKELGVEPKKDKAARKLEKEERKQLKREKKLSRHGYSRSRSPDRRSGRARSPSPDRHYRSSRRRSHSRSPPPPNGDRHRDDYRNSRHSRPSPPRGRSRSRSPLPDHIINRQPRERRSCSPRPSGSSGGTNGYRTHHRSSPPPPRDNGKRRYSSPSPRRRSPSPKRHRLDDSPARPPPRPLNNNTQPADDRAARLAAMSSNAVSLHEDRQKRLAALLEKEKKELEEDAEARKRSGGMSTFLTQEQKKVYGGVGGLEDRIRRGRGGMRVEAD